MRITLAIAVSIVSCQSLAGDVDFGIYLAQEQLKKEVSLEQGIGEGMQSGGITLAYSNSSENSLGLDNNPYDDYQAASGNFTALIGGGFISASDNEKFTVATVDSDDNVGDRSSNVSGTTIFAELGYNHFINANLDLFFNLGRASYSLDRSVSACESCPTEEVEINASNYLHTGLTFSDSPKIRVGYQHHHNGDMINSLRLQLAW